MKGTPVMLDGAWWLVEDVTIGDPRLLSLRGVDGSRRFDVPEQAVTRIAQAFVDRGVADRFAAAMGGMPTGMPIDELLEHVRTVYANHRAAVPRPPREEAAAATYGEQALASAIGEWSCLLREVEEQIGTGTRQAGDLEPANLAFARVSLRAVASAMRHTAEAARMVHASSCKRGGDRG